MEKRIKSITEAYSMQPIAHHVNDNILDPNEKSIENIVFRIDPNNGDKYDGFGFDGKLKFTWMANAVNVEYF